MTGILIDSNNDLIIQDGTLCLGNNAEQNAQLIIVAEKGEFKEYPQLGVGVSQFVKSVNRTKEMLRAIRIQLGLDNIKPKTIEFNNGKLQIDL